jgi:16S rRNA (cytosine967-C5)-methyltransferase
VPASAAVNTSTELAKTYGRKHGYVNGLLRTVDRKRDLITFPASEDRVRHLSLLFSHPDWLVRRWVERFGAVTAATLLEKNNLPAPLVIRTNTQRTTRAALKEALAAEGARAIETNYAPQGLEIISSPGLRSLTAYQQGWFMVQDQAAQLISLMLAPGPGESVLDACAAPGGKATHLAELMQDRGGLIALESDPDRAKMIRENSGRLGLTVVSTVRGDARKFRDGAYDKILIDAPCSGLGVLRRHPDGRWNKKENMLKERQLLQSRILENCAGLLKPGGALVYATCSTEPEENEEVIASFLTRGEGAFVLDDPRPFLPVQAAELVDGQGFFRSYPKAPELDGFVGVRIVRIK